MTDDPNASTTADAPFDPSRETFRPEELPPVQPPSAGFIVQLFVVPAIIVMAVVAVWALFGRLAAGEQDWQSLVTELANPNEHRRWRGAHGLAQLLQNDERQTGGERLAANPLIAEELAGLLERELQRPTQQDKDLKFQAFLARTLGMLDSPARILPALQQAMQPQYDREVRKNAVASVALIAGRETAAPDAELHNSVVASLISVSSDEDPLLRQLAAFGLGLMPCEQSQSRLDVMLNDSDSNTRLNAAVGLARQGSTQGLPIFEDVMSAAMEPIDESLIDAETETERAKQRQALEFEKAIALKNSFHALETLDAQLSDDERARAAGLLSEIAEQYPVAALRMEARRVQHELQPQE